MIRVTSTSADAPHRCDYTPLAAMSFQTPPAKSHRVINFCTSMDVVVHGRTAEELSMERALLRVGETAESIGFSRSKTYSLIKRGIIRSVRVDGVIRVPPDAIREFVDSLAERSDPR